MHGLLRSKPAWARATERPRRESCRPCWTRSAWPYATSQCGLAALSLCPLHAGALIQSTDWHSVPLSSQADGNCLYRAVEDQLLQCGAASEAAGGYPALRARVAAHMREHAADYAPFVLPVHSPAEKLCTALCFSAAASCSAACCCRQEEADGGDSASEVYEQYCRAVAETAAWGGQVELGALAALLQRRITVYSVGMPAVDMGPDAPGVAPSARQVSRRARPLSLSSSILQGRGCDLVRCVCCSQASSQHERCTWLTQSCRARSTGGAAAVLPAPRLWPRRALQQRGAQGVGGRRTVVNMGFRRKEGRGANMHNQCQAVNAGFGMPTCTYQCLTYHKAWNEMKVLFCLSSMYLSIYIYIHISENAKQASASKQVHRCKERSPTTRSALALLQDHMVCWLLANFASVILPYLRLLCLTGMRTQQSDLDSHTIVLLQPLTDRRSRTFLDFETVGKAVDGAVPTLQRCEDCRFAAKESTVRCRCVWPV